MLTLWSGVNYRELPAAERREPPAADEKRELSAAARREPLLQKTLTTL